MVARRQKVLVSVHDFGVQVRGDGAAVYLHQGVQEIHRQAVSRGAVKVPMCESKAYAVAKVSIF